MTKMTVERRDGQTTQTRETCYVVATQGWSGMIRDACSYCGVTVPADATHCPTCGRYVINR